MNALLERRDTQKMSALLERRDTQKMNALRIVTIGMIGACFAEKDSMRAGLARASMATVIDVGANGGLETSMALKSGRRVVSVECLSYAYASLLKKFKTHPNVTIVHACAANQTGLQTLYLASDSSSLIAENVRHGAERAKAVQEWKKTKRRTESVVVVRLDDLVKSPVSLIKLDVQGYESHVLQGAARILDTYHPVIVLETTFAHAPMPNYTCVAAGKDAICT